MCTHTTYVLLYFLVLCSPSLLLWFLWFLLCHFTMQLRSFLCTCKILYLSSVLCISMLCLYLLLYLMHVGCCYFVVFDTPKTNFVGVCISLTSKSCLYLWSFQCQVRSSSLPVLPSAASCISTSQSLCSQNRPLISFKL